MAKCKASTGSALKGLIDKDMKYGYNLKSLSENHCMCVLFSVYVCVMSMSMDLSCLK